MKSFKAVYVGPDDSTLTVYGLGGPFERGKVIDITEEQLQKIGITDEQTFFAQLKGIFEPAVSKSKKKSSEPEE